MAIHSYAQFLCLFKISLSWDWFFSIWNNCWKTHCGICIMYIGVKKFEFERTWILIQGHENKVKETTSWGWSCAKLKFSWGSGSGSGWGLGWGWGWCWGWRWGWGWGWSWSWGWGWGWDWGYPAFSVGWRGAVNQPYIIYLTRIEFCMIWFIWKLPVDFCTGASCVSVQHCHGASC